MTESLATLTFGKFKGWDIEDVPSSYLKYLLSQEWFEEGYKDYYEAVVIENNYRDKYDKHFES